MFYLLSFDLYPESNSTVYFYFESYFFDIVTIFRNAVGEVGYYFF